MTSLAPAPRILSLESPVPFGRYLGPIADLNLEDWDKKVSFRRRLQRKAWMFGGFFHPDWTVGIAIADAGYLGLAFCYLYDRKRKIFVEEKATRPFAFEKAFNPALSQVWKFSSGSRHWTIEPSPRGWAFAFQGKRLQLSFLLASDYPGLTAVAPAGPRPFNCTYKLAGVSGLGSLRLDGEALGTEDTQAVLDFTVGYPERRIFWNWACLAARADSGEKVGLNLVAHFNDSLENGLWVDGTLIPLSVAEFKPGRLRDQEAWNVRTEDGIVDLEFHPEGARSEKLFLGAVQSRFTQPFGKIAGTLRLPNKSLTIRGQGIFEEHFALW